MCFAKASINTCKTIFRLKFNLLSPEKSVTQCSHYIKSFSAKHYVVRKMRRYKKFAVL